MTLQWWFEKKKYCSSFLRFDKIQKKKALGFANKIPILHLCNLDIIFTKCVVTFFER